MENKLEISKYSFFKERMSSLMKYLVILQFFLISCGSGSNSNLNIRQEAQEMAPVETDGAKTNVEMERKLIKKGDISFETTDLQSSRKTIFEAVEKYSAYVSSDQEYTLVGQRHNEIEIRVPAKDFDHFLQDATIGVERFDTKHIDVKDVTEEFLDVQARLKVKKELENRYLNLIEQAKNVSDILEIEREIGKLRGEIESIEGRLNYLKNQVSLATITLQLYQNYPQETDYGSKLKNGIVNGWNNLLSFFIALLNVWPFIVLIVVLFFGIRSYRKKRNKT
jgi:hypothetical protein